MILDHESSLSKETTLNMHRCGLGRLKDFYSQYIVTFDVCLVYIFTSNSTGLPSATKL